MAAGSALAMPANAELINADTGGIISNQDLKLREDVPLNIQFMITDYTYSESGHTYTYTADVTPWYNENGNTVGSKSDVVVELPSPASFTIPQLTSKNIIGHNFVDDKKITVTLVNRVVDDKEAPANYKITIGGVESFTLAPLNISSTDVAAPEFPSIALPVAGIVGLLFFFGRKKEGL